ncbi:MULTISPECIES: TOMM precursor leader peptide-binding protein [Variovorax]|mgnify:CR=1 FL=1|jgi:oxazoline/thiazoline synthase|uniref:TOMM precursor leader peptide-binding protein n=1 Tax=Variovorax TaxID=34072 RepID=UPI000A51B6AC|nr:MULTISPECIES: TOMM precursor leader peptide-binding protein [Variovorax]UKI07893.1 TOMM precursor leader peptide-binding protein [Variovorax paradoxus]
MRDAAAPDLFGDVFQWHEKYLPPTVLRDRLLLLSENELLVLGSPGVMALERVLREGVSLATYCRDASAGALLAEMLHALGALLRQGLVRPVMLRGGEAYLLPDFSASHAPMAVSAHVDAISLTDAVGRGAALRWGQALAEEFDEAGDKVGDEAGLTIVFCDDYLDPRLGAIDARQRSKGRPWLLVKPAGEQAMVGPLFTPRPVDAEGDAGHAHEAPACWHCLSHRWLRNRPARAWWRARHGDLGSGPPVRAGASLVVERLDGLLAKARQMVAQRGDAQAVWTLDPLERNPVVARPQCPQCGTPGLMALVQHGRIAPVPGGPVASADGGWRTAPASATVERLSRHVGPLCGVIARVKPLNAESEDMLTVYRSEIFKTPPPFGDPAPGAWTQVCLGKGMSAAQSRASAMCEAVERYSAFYQGDEATVIAPAADLDAPCIAPTALARFSEHQKSQFDTEKPPHAVVSTDAQPQEPTWWAPAWSLTADARRYLPLAFCHAHAPAESQYHVTWTSNGCAAGNTVEEAILQGFLELVERDAAAIWWYGQVRRPAIDLDGMPVASRLRLSRTWGLQWAHWVLDITHDFGIPVVVAVGRHRQTGEWAIGFGCSPDRMLACERALTEMSQLIAAGKTFPVPSAAGLEGPPAFLMPMEEGGTVPLRAAPDPDAPRDIAGEIARCVGIAAGLGLETIVLDHSRPDIPLRTVKVVVPGLCHIWPELGNPRLYAVPVAMGWRRVPAQEADLNPQALYV